jgi:Flp pilus assembly protein TadG
VHQRHDRDLDGAMTRRLFRRTGDRTRGQGLVEFALVFPLVMLLILGGIDVARGVYAYNTLANAARHGARVAAVNQLDPSATTTQCNESMPIENPSAPRWSWRGCAASTGSSAGAAPGNVSVAYGAPPGVTISCSPTLRVGCVATITVTSTWQPITPVVSSLIGPISLSATSEHVVERVFP